VKRILITGATSGIGLALANLCCQSAYKVIGCGRNQQVLQHLSQHYNHFTPLCFDATDMQQTTNALKRIDCDILVLNAGNCEYVDANELEPELFRRVMEINFFSVINILNIMLPQLRAGSQVVIVDSLARLLPFTRSQAYGASKAALYYLTKTLEVDLADKDILFQSVSPGFVKTPLTDRNRFVMPMRISAQQAARLILQGIEQRHTSIYFPTIFSLILRLLSRLPTKLQVLLSKRMKQK